MSDDNYLLVMATCLMPTSSHEYSTRTVIKSCLNIILWLYALCNLVSIYNSECVLSFVAIPSWGFL